MRGSLFRLIVPIAVLVSGLLAGGCGGSGGATLSEPVPMPPPPPEVPVLPTLRTFAYVSNVDGIQTYRIDETGAMNAVGLPVGGPIVNSLVFHPSGQFAYAVNINDNSVSTYKVDGVTGLLTFLSSVASGFAPAHMQIHPAGSFGYVTSYGGTLSIYSIHPLTGELASAGSLDVSAELIDIVMHPSGRNLYVESNGTVAAYSVDETGALEFVNSVVVGVGPRHLALAPSGNALYVTNTDADNISIHGLDAASGALGSSTLVPGGDGVSSIAIDPAGRFAYVANLNADSVTAYKIESGGNLTFVAAADAMRNPASVVAEPSGRFVYMRSRDDNAVAVYEVDQETGELTFLSELTTAVDRPASVQVARFLR